MKLLLAEDDIKLGALVKSLLEFSGFETEWARDGREALERIREAAASSYDVVILGCCPRSAASKSAAC